MLAGVYSAILPTRTKVPAVEVKEHEITDRPCRVCGNGLLIVFVMVCEGEGEQCKGRAGSR